MDGYIVKPMLDASSIGDIFITSTGCKDIITGTHIEKMKNNRLLQMQVILMWKYL